MSEFYGATDDAESIATIHRALDLGITFLDSADVYGPRKNEELVGRAIQGKRDKVVLATKFGIVRDPNKPSARGVNGKPAYVRQSCESSLRRLQVDTVDPNTPIEETDAAMAQLIKEGKIRHIGLSEASATLRRAPKVHPITALQTECPLWSRDAEAEILKTCRDLRIGFVGYSPLGRGIGHRPNPPLRRPGPRRFPPQQPALSGRKFPEKSGLGRQGRRISQRKTLHPIAIGISVGPRAGS